MSTCTRRKRTSTHSACYQTMLEKKQGYRCFYQLSKSKQLEILCKSRSVGTTKLVKGNLGSTVLLTSKRLFSSRSHLHDFEICSFFWASGVKLSRMTSIWMNLNDVSYCTLYCIIVLFMYFHHGTPCGNTIGPCTSDRFSGPQRISTSLRANGNAVPVSVKWGYRKFSRVINWAVLTRPSTNGDKQ